MIATTQDLLVRSEADFDRLPEDGFFEVVEGRAILLPANDVPHQQLSFALARAFDRQLRALGSGFVFQSVNVFLPPPPDSFAEIQNRVPDLIVSTHRPDQRFRVGAPPELVIEILSTRRGNVERTEKLDDYARAGIGEYWIVNPFDRAIEVCLLRQGDYVLQETSPPLRPRAFAGVEIDPQEIWAALA